MTRARIPIPQDRLADFCRKHHIRKLSLFGSVLRDDFTPQSDVDVLVEFEPEHVPGFIRLHSIEQELSSMFEGRRIDIVSEKYLSPYLRDRVLAGAEVEYGAGWPGLPAAHAGLGQEGPRAGKDARACPF